MAQKLQSWWTISSTSSNAKRTAENKRQCSRKSTFVPDALRKKESDQTLELCPGGTDRERKSGAGKACCCRHERALILGSDVPRWQSLEGDVWFPNQVNLVKELESTTHWDLG